MPNDTDLNAEVIVSPSTVLSEISPLIYGSNIEHLGKTINRGAWGELVWNRKFCGHDESGKGSPLQRPRSQKGRWERHTDDPPDFGVANGWQVKNPAPNIFLVHDNTTFYSGSQSQRIDILNTDGNGHGVMQKLWMPPHQDLNCRIVVRSHGNMDRMDVVLVAEDGSTTRWTIDLSDCEDWSVFSKIIQTSGGNGSLEILAHGEGQLWIGAISLMAHTHHKVGGWNTEVIDSMKSCGITMLRWPGGNFASDYHWRNGIGDVDRRPSIQSRAWGDWDPNDYGTDEFLRMCKAYDFVPFIVVNAGSGTDSEASDWIEYCNGEASSPLGQLRKQNGHTDPYAVHHWSIGNEMWGNFQIGHVDPETYERRMAAFAKAMLDKDSSIHLTGVGHVRNTGMKWNEKVAATKANIQALSVHYYPFNVHVAGDPPSDGPPWNVAAAGAEESANVIKDSINIIDRYWEGTQPAEISFDEWNMWVGVQNVEPWLNEPFRLQDGLYTAALFNELHRLSDRVTMAHQAMAVNRLGLMKLEQGAIIETPMYQAFQLCATHCGDEALQTEVQSPLFNVDSYATFPPRNELNLVNCMATRRKSDGNIVLVAVNLSETHTVKLSVLLDHPHHISESALVREINGKDPRSFNNLLHPYETWIVERETVLEIKDNRFEYELPSHSITMLDLNEVRE